MRRSERAVTDPERIFDILSRCDVIRVGMNAGDYPYVIPMTFGAEQKDGVITVYFHSAGAGRKWDILQKDPRVCVEADLYYKTVHTQSGGITAQYESVIGTGKAERITDREGKLAAIACILAHYKESGFPATSCKGLAQVEVFRVVLDEVCGKHNMDEENAG